MFARTESDAGIHTHLAGDTVPKNPMSLNMNTRVRWSVLKKLPVIKACRGKKILDVGCGLGFFSQQLAELGAEVTAIDVDRPALEFVSSNYSVTTEAVDVDSGAFPRGDFDVVLVGEILEHMADPADLMRKSRDVLAADGTLVLTTPALEGWLTQSKGKRLAHEHGSEKHERDGFYYTELETMAQNAGLEVVDHRLCLQLMAELFMQLTKLGYILGSKQYEGQSDVLRATRGPAYKLLGLVFPIAWPVVLMAESVSARLGRKGHCHVLLARRCND